MHIQKILVPVDFSNPSKKALNYGLSLALQFDARLVLAHIVPANTHLSYAFPAESFAHDKELASESRASMPLLIPDAYRDRVNLESIVRVGSIKDELLAIIEEADIDLVVMGTHGNNALQRLMVGSVTEQLLRQLPVPVLTVSHIDPELELHDASPMPIHRILSATDLSDNGRNGLKMAVELARAYNATITVLHVFKPTDPIFWGAEAGSLALDLESLRQNAISQIRELINPDWRRTIDIIPMLVEGDAFREILRVSEQAKMDLIVMDLQRKGALERAILGSTAEKVIRSARVPVLSVPVKVAVAAAKGAK